LYGRLLDNETFIKDSEDFAIRRYARLNTAIPILFATVYIMLVAMAKIWMPSIPVLFHLIAGGGLLMTGSIVMWYLRKYQKMLSTVELQNLLFATATRQATDFGAIIRYDGTLIYVTPEYQELLARYKAQGLEGFEALNAAGLIGKKDVRKLQKALADRSEEHMDIQLTVDGKYSALAMLSLEPLSVTSEHDYPHDVRLAIEPMARPSGYFFLRACRYHEGHEGGSIFDQFKIGHFILSDDGAITETNDLFASLLGYSLKTWPKKKPVLADFVNGEFSLDQYLEDGQWHGLTYLQNKKGNLARVYMALSKTDIGDGGYTIDGVALPLPMDALRAGMPTQLENSEQEWVEHSPIATAVLDMQERIVYSNAAFRHITSTDDGSEAMHKLEELIMPDVYAEVKQWFEKIRGGGVSTPLEAKLRHDETDVSLYMNLIADEQGHGDHLILHIIDKTELKNLEMRFVHSQKMQAVGQLAGGVAHDFNNLLTAMMGFCDLLLLRHPAGDPSFADIMQIKQNANRAANLVRQLLAFSRKQTLQPEIVNITDTLADLSNLIGRLIGENIELKMEYGRDIGAVKVDQGQLEQVIVNLAVNARDAMSDGGVLHISTKNITISSKNRPSRSMVPPAEDEVIDNGSYVQIDVEDSGCGIPKSDLGKVFEPFYSTKKIGEGTGLGLATVYGIIKQTGGYLYVSSEVDKGTKFSIFLKRHQEDENDKTNKEASNEQPEQEATDLTGRGTILLVEDETPVRLFSMSALRGKGYNVLEAEDGSVALEIMEERGKEVDAIITDVVMPGLNGPEMIQEVLKDYPGIKVIFVSGYAEDEFMQTYGDKRQFHFLPKPYTLKQLALKVKEVLGA
jgi:two-component system cell cycle sensor histidine kinase/response regulator CckA